MSLNWNEFVKDICNTTIKDKVSGDVIHIIRSYCHVEPIVGYETWADYEFAGKFDQSEDEQLYRAIQCDDDLLVKYRIRMAWFIHLDEDLIRKIIAADTKDSQIHEHYTKKQVETVFEMYMELLDNMADGPELCGDLIAELIKIVCYIYENDGRVVKNGNCYDIIDHIIIRCANTLDLNKEVYRDYQWDEILMLATGNQWSHNTEIIIRFIMQNHIEIAVDSNHLTQLCRYNWDAIISYILSQVHLNWNIELIEKLAAVEVERYTNISFPRFLVKNNLVNKSIVDEIKKLQDAPEVNNDLQRFGDRLRYYFDHEWCW